MKNIYTKIEELEGMTITQADIQFIKSMVDLAHTEGELDGIKKFADHISKDEVHSTDIDGINMSYEGVN